MGEIARVCKPGGTVMLVNHFASTRPALRWLERLLTPLSQWIGFRLDLPVSVVTREPRLDVVREERVNLLGLWRVVELRRR
jgi:phosphatidylethanolamine/phosphatidyl-N-methylethanolamine N-methyltransferase